MNNQCSGFSQKSQSPFVMYIFFKNRNFNYQSYVCNECHGASLCAQWSTDLNIITIKNDACGVVSNIHTTKWLVCLKQVT